MTTKPFRLMDLPRELRDGVYRELLLPAKVRLRGERLPDEKKRFYALQPAILRVCKQTYIESSRVLYKETNWVLISSSSSSEGRSPLRAFKKAGYPYISLQDPLNFTGMLVLRMEMSSGLDTDHKYQDCMLIPQWETQLFGNFLANNLACITLRFDEDAMQTLATREVLLHRCSDLRGTHSVIVEGLNPIDCAKLADIMTTPIRRIEEYLERAETYQQRADHQLAQGRFLDAGRAYAEGALYVRWAGKQKIGDLPGSTPQIRIELKEKEVDFLIETAFCLTKVGRLKSTRRLLDLVLKHDGNSPLPTKEQEIKAYCCKALTFVAERDDILAAVEFRMVLSLLPCHAGADEKVFAIEAMLQTIPQAERYEVKAYLKDFMKSYRHGEPGSAGLSEEEMPVDDHAKIAT